MTSKAFLSLSVLTLAAAVRVETTGHIERNGLETADRDAAKSSNLPSCRFDVLSCASGAGRCRVNQKCLPLHDCSCRFDKTAPVVQVPLCHDGQEVPTSKECTWSARDHEAYLAQRAEARRWKREYNWTRGPVAEAQPFRYVKTADVLNFMILGDFGGSSDTVPVTKVQLAVAHGMGVAGERLEPSFVLGLGDNFYSTGVHVDNRWRLNSTYNGVYTHQSLQVPWYNVAGNHDWGGKKSIQTQIEYTKESDRWVLPAAHYTFTKPLPSGKTIKFVMFDHLQLQKLRDYTPLAWSERGRPKLQGVQWSEQPFKSRIVAREWLEQELASSTDHYLILVDHHPIYTVCSHDYTVALRDLPELMRKYRVTAFMSGHDHCASTIQHDGNTFILQGAGSQPWNKAIYHGKVEAMGADVLFSIHRDNSNGTMGSFSTAEASDSELTIRHHDHDGNVLFQMPALRPRI